MVPTVMHLSHEELALARIHFIIAMFPISSLLSKDDSCVIRAVEKLCGRQEDPHIEALIGEVCRRFKAPENER